MFYGPFDLKISTQAEKIDVSSLASNEVEALCHGTKFDPAEHDAFRFFVMPEFRLILPVLNQTKIPRAAKKQSFSAADRVCIQTHVGSPSINIHGIYPTSRRVGGQAALDLPGDSIYEVNADAPLIGKIRLRLRGPFKHRIKHTTHDVLAARTDKLAQWLFLKGYLNSSVEFGLHLLCTVPKDLGSRSRFLKCQAQVFDEGRLIADKSGRVVFPS